MQIRKIVIAVLAFAMRRGKLTEDEARSLLARCFPRRTETWHIMTAEDARRKAAS